jgi:hypothetical protein
MTDRSADRPTPHEPNFVLPGGLPGAGEFVRQSTVPGSLTFAWQRPAVHFTAWPRHVSASQSAVVLQWNVSYPEHFVQSVPSLRAVEGHS